MTIKWWIESLTRRASDGYVTRAYWGALATDAEYSASQYGQSQFDGALNVPYDNLTEETVLSWVWMTVNKDAIEAKLAADIQAQKVPVYVSGVPWDTSDSPA